MSQVFWCDPGGHAAKITDKAGGAFFESDELPASLPPVDRPEACFDHLTELQQEHPGNVRLTIWYFSRKVTDNSELQLTGNTK